jgi:predicted ferric reductase
MTTTSPPTPRTAAPAPALTARLVLGAAVLANVVLVETLFLAFGTGKNAILTAAKFFGLNASLVMMVQLVLVARLPWLDRRIGMDRLTAWHRWVGFALLWTVLLHASLIVAGYAALYGMTPLASFLSLAGVVASLLGMLAAAIIVVAAVVSVRSARRRLQYETWHAVHFLLYVAVGVGVAHQLLEGTTFPASPAATAYWWALWALVLLALLAGRIGLPLLRNARHRFRVAAVVPESDDVVSIHLTGRHLEELPARAGQFMIWRFLGHNRWWQANPFSLSASPDGRSLRLTAKAAGATSAGLRHVPVGTRVFVEGPYGAFTGMHRTRRSTLLVAGGVGVTPIRALLEEGTGPTVVLYRVRSEADAVLLGELRELARSRGARLHVLTGRTSPDNNPFDPANLLGMVPDVAEREVFVCGPPAMTSAVLNGLRALGVPRRQVHAERFGLG